MAFRPVIYYTHEGSDDQHYAVDSYAFVLREYDETDVELAILPVGGPIKFARVKKYIVDTEPDPVGYAYWREADEDPPDFNAVAEATTAQEEEHNA